MANNIGSHIIAAAKRQAGPAERKAQREIQRWINEGRLDPAKVARWRSHDWRDSEIIEMLNEGAQMAAAVRARAQA